MPAHTLRFTSPEKIFVLEGKCDPHSATVDQCRVSEALTPNTDKQNGAGSYHIVLEADVKSEDEQIAAGAKMREIADDLDIAWCYVFGEPFKAIRTQFVLDEGPQDWRGNFNEVRGALQRDAGNHWICEAMGIATQTCLGAPFLPLERLLKARAAYLAASPLLRELIGLHVSAYKTQHGKLFMLAKALEVVGRHYGAKRVTRNSGTQLAMDRMGVTPHLKHNVEWLFNLANQRFDIRHAVNDKAPGVSLHPKVTPAEYRDFEEDTALIVRAFISDQLGLDELRIVMKK